MKHLPLTLLVLAGAALAWVAWRAPERDRGIGAVVAADGFATPTALSGDLPDGFVVRALAVEGMCKECCPPNVYRALSLVQGVREAAVDMAAERAWVVVPEDLDPAQLVAALGEEYPASVLP